MPNSKRISQLAFDKQAPTYDYDIKGQHARGLYPFLLQKISAIPFESALDLGCGTGEMMKRILQKYPQKQLWGLDLSEKMLEVAGQKLQGKVKLTLGDSEHLPYADASFDLVYCNDSFHHYPNPQKALQEVWRVLKEQGTLLLCDCWQPGIARWIMNRYMKFSQEGDVKLYSEREIREMLSKDFHNVQWQRIGTRAYMATGIK